MNPKTKAKEIMTPEPLCIEEDTTLKDAIHAMRSHEKKVTSAVVVSKRNRHFKGIITGKEIVDWVKRPENIEALAITTVDEQLVEYPPYINPEDTITKVAAIMDKWQLDHLVVVDQFIPVGVISYGDILDYLDEYG